MARFQRPTHGNVDRKQPVNSVRNLQRWLNRQARDRKVAANLSAEG